MTLRRVVSGALAGTALLGVPLVTGGVASAHESSDPAPASECNAVTEGTATGSPGVDSGNVVQVPVLNCSEVNVVRF